MADRPSSDAESTEDRTSTTLAGSVQGTVTDSSGTLIDDAFVTVTDASSGTPVTTVTTDENGDYSTSSVPDDTYDVYCEKPEYVQQVETGVSVSGSTETVNFALQDRPYKVQGDLSDVDGRGVVGRNTAGSGTPRGVMGYVPNAPKGRGVLGYTGADAGDGPGVEGITESSVDGAVGVLGVSNADGDQASGTLPSGVRGEVTGSGPRAGVSGIGNGGVGVFGTGNWGLYTPDDARIDGRLLTTGEAWELRLDGSPAIRLDGGASGGGGNVAFGHPSNSIASGVVGSAIGGGRFDDGSTPRPNVIYDNYSTIGGGRDNQTGTSGSVTDLFATVPGGEGNEVSGQYSFAAGRNAKATNDGAFVWADSNSTDVSSQDADEVRLHASGGIFLRPDLPTGSGNAVGIDPTTGQLRDISSSSARYKSDVQPLADTGSVLDLSPRSFEYRETGDRSVGFVAEEVEEICPELVTEDEEGRPSGIQYEKLGVFLVPEVRENRDRSEHLEAEIGDLGAENEDLEAEIQDLRAENEELRERNADLEDRLAAVEAHLGVGDESDPVVADD